MTCRVFLVYSCFLFFVIRMLVYTIIHLESLFFIDNEKSIYLFIHIKSLRPNKMDQKTKQKGVDCFLLIVKIFTGTVYLSLSLYQL